MIATGLLMGAIRLIYDETLRQMKKLGWSGELNLEATRKALASNLRYCLQGNTLYLPEDESLISNKHRLCWGRIRVEELDELPWLAEFDTELPEDPLAYHRPFTGIGFGTVYSRRHRESKTGRVPVSAFVAQSLIDAIGEDPDTLLKLSKTQFEALAAELFARRGFDVDLFRPSKDDGIDFIAVRNEDTPEPVILAVQTKHPDVKAEGKRRNVLPVSTVREIYGVSKAWNLQGAIAITSSTYSRDAKRFADMKPEEMEVVNAADIIAWARQYRWNGDE
jgi:hypothetical protein